MTAEPKVQVFSRSENAQETAFCTDVPSSCEGIVKWFSSVFLASSMLGKRGIFWLTDPHGFAQFEAWHGAIRATFSNRQFLCMFAPSATSIANLFNTAPPTDFLTYGVIGYNPLDYSGAIGRYFKVNLRHQF